MKHLFHFYLIIKDAKGFDNKKNHPSAGRMVHIEAFHAINDKHLSFYYTICNVYFILLTRKICYIFLHKTLDFQFKSVYNHKQRQVM